AGDLLDMAGYATIDAQIVVVHKYISRLQELVPLLVCSGNHDCDEKNPAGEFVATWLRKAEGERVWVDGQSVPLHGDLYTAFPWWDGPVSRQDMEQQLERERAQIRKRW